MTWQIVTLVLGLWWLGPLRAACYSERTKQRKEAVEHGLFGAVTGKQKDG